MAAALPLPSRYSMIRGSTRCWRQPFDFVI